MPQSRKNQAQFRGFQVGDAIMVAGSFLASSMLWAQDDFWIMLRAEPWTELTPLVIAILSSLMTLFISGSYGGVTSFRRSQQISLVLGVLFLIESFFSYARLPWALDLRVTAGAAALCALLLMSWFLIYRVLFPDFLPARRYLLLGDDPALDDVKRWLASAPTKFQATGPIADLSGIKGAAGQVDPDQIVVGYREARNAPPVRTLLDLRLAGVVIEDAAEAYENVLQRVSLRHLKPTRMLFGKPAPNPKNVAWQAIYSNLAGLLALVITSPILLSAVLALKLTAPRQPAVEARTCSGFSGIPFSLRRLQSRTWLGRWLARLRLDGLPQLLNVVRGEMSLVGPRPQRVEYVQVLCRHIPFYTQMLRVKPGLTGWAQIHTAASTGNPKGNIAAFSDTFFLNTLRALEYDLYYIENLSPLFDLEILLSAVFGGAGIDTPVGPAGSSR